MTKKELVEKLADVPDDAPVYVCGERGMTGDGIYPVTVASYTDDPEETDYHGIPRRTLYFGVNVEGEVAVGETPIFRASDRVLVRDPDGSFPPEPGYVTQVYRRGDVPPGVPGEYVGREPTNRYGQFYLVELDVGGEFVVGEADLTIK